MSLMMILATLTALGVLITIHEFGHFYVARRCGIKVLTFSIGFGPKVFSRTGKDGVLYQIAALPLGGYVRMLDSREGEVSAAEKSQAFDQKSLGQRAAVVAAGPAINLLFAALVYAILAMAGSQFAAPIVGQVTPGSKAEQAGIPAGHEIVALYELELSDETAVDADSAAQLATVNMRWKPDLALTAWMSNAPLRF
ncbi:MAG: RIP metalloprotease RseP [Litorivicinus sp.]